MALTLASGAARGQTTATPAVADLVQGLTRESAWKLVETVPMKFTTHHPQGMVKIGDDALRLVGRGQGANPPVPATRRRLRSRRGRGRRASVQGRPEGQPARRSQARRGTIYHPGGIDYDGRYIWVPVAEYRPNSRSIIYRVDPTTMKAEEVFRFADHIGGIVHDTDDHTLHGVSWGSRRFYRWTLDAGGKVTNADVPPEKLRTLNTSHYVDYQDCKYAGRHRMLCTGVTELRQSPDAPPFRLGGLELVDLRDGRPLHQVPVLLWTAGGLDMTHNPVWIEADRNRPARATSCRKTTSRRSTCMTWRSDERGQTGVRPGSDRRLTTRLTPSDPAPLPADCRPPGQRRRRQMTDCAR